MVMDSLLYQPGDLVTIRSDLVGDRDYPVLYGPSAGKRTLYCNDSMVNYSGNTYEVNGYSDDDDFYTLREFHGHGLSRCLKARPNAFVTVYCNQKKENENNGKLQRIPHSASEAFR